MYSRVFAGLNETDISLASYSRVLPRLKETGTFVVKKSTNDMLLGAIHERPANRRMGHAQCRITQRQVYYLGSEDLE